MGRAAGAGPDWNAVNAVLVREFTARSVVLLGVLAVGGGWLLHDGRLAVGLLAGGGWMVVNCVAIAWMGANALRHSATQPGRYVLGFIAAIVGSLAVGGWLALALQPVLLGVTIGLSVSLTVFLAQLRRLKRKLASH